MCSASIVSTTSKASGVYGFNLTLSTTRSYSHCSPASPQLLVPPGIPQKLLAMESLLASRPELVGKVMLLQIAVPTRTEVPEYQRLRSVAHRLVGRINGRFGTPSYTPIHYLDQVATASRVLLPC